MSLSLRAYSAAASAVYPFIRGILRRRHAEGFSERCGAYEKSKLDKLSGERTLWLHAVSVGEVQAAYPFVSMAAGSGLKAPILLSTVTVTGAKNALSLIGSDIAAHIYAPWDVPYIVRRACGALCPFVYVTVETEVWPNLLAELRNRGVPSVLLNARVSDRTWLRAGFFKGSIREAYGMFDMILARGEEDARRLSMMGADSEKIHVTGDSKIDALIIRKDAVLPRLPALRKRIFSSGEDAHCLVAGSTHEGEDEILLEAFGRISSGSSPLRGAKLAIAPRHPERSGSIASMAGKFGKTALYSELCPSREADIIVVDVMGILFELYGLADAAFIGGSMVSKGGQNILEPAIWGVPVLHGPHMEDFAEHTAELDSSGAAYRVGTPGDVEGIWRDAASGRLPNCGEAVSKFFSDKSGASARAWGYFEKYL